MVLAPGLLRFPTERVGRLPPIPGAAPRSGALATAGRCVADLCAIRLGCRGTAHAAGRPAARQGRAAGRRPLPDGSRCVVRAGGGHRTPERSGATVRGPAGCPGPPAARAGSLLSLTARGLGGRDGGHRPAGRPAYGPDDGPAGGGAGPEPDSGRIALSVRCRGRRTSRVRGRPGTAAGLAAAPSQAGAASSGRRAAASEEAGAR